MPGFVSPDPCHATLLQGTAALSCKGGIIGGSAGAAKDTLLLGYIIEKNAGPATLTVGGGLADSNGAAQNMLLSGSTTADTEFWFPAPILNEAGAFTFTPSVAGAVWVFTRPYTGSGVST